MALWFETSRRRGKGHTIRCNLHELEVLRDAIHALCHKNAVFNQRRTRKSGTACVLRHEVDEYFNNRRKKGGLA